MADQVSEITQPNIVDVPHVDSSSGELPTIPDLSQTKIPDFGKMAAGMDGISPDMKSMLANLNMGEMMKRITQDPEGTQKIMEESMGKINPNMIEQMKNMAMGGQGEKMMKQMQKQGVDPRALKSQLMNQQRALRAAAAKTGGKQKKVLIINQTRVLKSKSIPDTMISNSAAKILNCSNPVELSCSKLAQGPLSGKTIKVWYDPDVGGKNRRATRIMGFPIGSSLMIVMEEGDLKESEFIEAESHLA